MIAMEAERPKVGIGIFLLKDNSILLGRRNNSHGEGEYALPGGHLELHETFEDCVLRERRHYVQLGQRSQKARIIKQSHISSD